MCGKTCSGVLRFARIVNLSPDLPNFINMANIVRSSVRLASTLRRSHSCPARRAVVSYALPTSRLSRIEWSTIKVLPQVPGSRCQASEGEAYGTASFNTILAIRAAMGKRRSRVVHPAWQVKYHAGSTRLCGHRGLCHLGIRTHRKMQTGSHVRISLALYKPTFINTNIHLHRKTLCRTFFYPCHTYLPRPSLQTHTKTTEQPIPEHLPFFPWVPRNYIETHILGPLSPAVFAITRCSQM
jgi:hypothetical protein